MKALLPADPAAADARVQWPLLILALALMVAVTVNPRWLAAPGGRADHVLAAAVFWAMSAGFVRGVGFVPHTAWICWLFSGWACLLALALAMLVRVLRTVA